MKAVIIKYSIKELEIKNQNILRRKLLGYNDYSNDGKYEYKRYGLLDEIEHVKLSNGLILVPKKFSGKILYILKKYKAKVNNYSIDISQKEFDKKFRIII